MRQWKIINKSYNRFLWNKKIYKLVYFPMEKLKTRDRICIKYNKIQNE